MSAACFITRRKMLYETEIGVVFPKITDKDIADLEIEKIRVSKTEEK